MATCDNLQEAAVGVLQRIKSVYPNVSSRAGKHKHFIPKEMGEYVSFL